MTNEEEIQKTVLDTIKKRKNNESIKEVNINGLPNNMKPEQKIYEHRKVIEANNLTLKALLGKTICLISKGVLEELIKYNTEFLTQNK